MKKIVLFDGDCTFCNKSVQFILKRDPKKYFYFSPLQSEFSENLLKNNTKTKLNSIVFVDNGRFYYKSTAALRICKYLRGCWKIFYLLLLVPKSIRDSFYDIVAKHRNKLTRKQSSCKLPSNEERNRFLT